MARPVPAADGAGRIRPLKALFACLPRSIPLGGAGIPAPCAWMGSGSRAGLFSDIAHGGVSGMEGGRGAPSGQTSGVQFQSPDLLGPTRPALQLLLAVAQRLRVDLGLLRERRWGAGGGGEKGAVRSGAVVPGRPHLAPASGLPAAFIAPRIKKWFFFFFWGGGSPPPPSRPLQQGGKRPPLTPNQHPLPLVPGKRPGEGKDEPAGPGGLSLGESAREPARLLGEDFSPPRCPPRVFFFNYYF